MPRTIVTVRTQHCSRFVHRPRRQAVTIPTEAGRGRPFYGDCGGLSAVRTACIAVCVSLSYGLPSPHVLAYVCIVVIIASLLYINFIHRRRRYRHSDETRILGPELCWIWWTKWPNSSSKRRWRSSRSRKSGRKWWTMNRRCYRPIKPSITYTNRTTTAAVVSRRPAAYVGTSSNWTTWSPAEALSWKRTRRLCRHLHRRRRRVRNAERITTWKWRQTAIISERRSAGPWKTWCTRLTTKSPGVFVITRNPWRN